MSLYFFGKRKDLSNDDKNKFFHQLIFVRDPFADENDKNSLAPVRVDVDLSLTAFANAER